MPVNVLLPLSWPDTRSLRGAASNIIRDIQRQHDLTDGETAEKLGVSIGTIRNIRNKESDIGALLLAKIGAMFGEDAIAPYRALYAGCGEECAEPMLLLAEAQAALAKAKGPKGKFDALPALKDCIEGLSAFVLAAERDRLRLVS